MPEGSNSEKTILLLSQGEGVRQLGDTVRSRFPEDERNHVAFGKINSWLHQIRPPVTSKENDELENAQKRRYAKAGPFYSLEPLPDNEQKLYLLNTMHTFLVPMLTEAVACFNNQPLTENGDPLNTKEYQDHLIVVKALENGVLEAADVILTYYLTYCSNEFERLRSGYPDYCDKSYGPLSRNPIQPAERKLLESGCSPEEIERQKELICKEIKDWRQRITIIRDLRRGIDLFFAGTKAFISHEKTEFGTEEYQYIGGEVKKYLHQKVNYPWDRLLARLQGTDPEVQKAFATLNLEKTANTTPINAREVTKAYRLSLIKAHPDNGGSKEQVDMVEKAYSLALTVSKIGDDNTP